MNPRSRTLIGRRALDGRLFDAFYARLRRPLSLFS